MHTTPLPPGFLLRPAAPDDLAGVTDLIIALDIADTGESDVTEQDLEQDWAKPGFCVGEDAWVVVDERSASTTYRRIVGYVELWNRAGHVLLQADGFVHPQTRGLGIGSTLLRAMEARARQHIPLAQPELQVSVRNGVYGADEAATRIHDAAGFTLIRYFWRMEITLDAPPSPPEWPDGLALRTFVPGQDDRRVYEAIDEAFSDHWSHVQQDYDYWRQRNLQVDGFDPQLWLLAVEGDEIAGFALCSTKAEKGWVQTLGVRRPWRRAGLGLALLEAAFGEFWQRGYRRVGLGVDASNPTGATRLYQRAGMHVAHEIKLFEKVLRPGASVVPD